MKFFKRLFGGIDLSWPKLIAFAIVMGIYTALMAIIPQVRYTSFNTISVTNMEGLFRGCSSLKSIDLSNFAKPIPSLMKLFPI